MEIINGVGRVGIRNYVEPVSLSSIVSSGLILNLDAGNAASYPGTGTTWTDLSGNGNHATLYNGAAYSSTNGGTLTFDGINDYIRMPFETILNNCSIEIWFRNTSTNIYQYLLSLSNLNNSTNALYFDMNDPEVAAYRTMWVYWNSNGGLLSAIPRTSGTNGDWTDSTWRHYVFTRSTTVSPYTSHYMNGSLVSNVNRSSTQTTNFGNGAGYYLTIGGVTNGSWGGNVAIVRIYNKVLTSSEIKQNFDASKSRYGY